MLGIIYELLNLYLVILILTMVLSWFPASSDGPMVTVRRVLWQLTNPVLAPIRRALPDVRLGGMMLDLSPFVLFIIIVVIQGLIR